MTSTIPNPGGATSRITPSYGYISFCAGAINTVPTEYLRVDYLGNITAENGAVFVGNLSGNALTSTYATFAETISRNLSGVISGLVNATTIANGNITNAML